MKTRSEISELRTPPWHHIYFVLTSFNVVVAIATLLLSAIVFEIYVSSIDEHSAWTKRAGDATELFRLHSLGDRTNVGLRMVMMDQHFARSSAALAATQTIIRNRQSLILSREALGAKSLQNYEYFIVCIILLMIVIVLSYVYQLTKRMRSNDNRLEDILAQNRGIIDTAGDGIITINHVGIVGTFNPASERIFG
jgi:PAS domain-containing protein